MRTEWLVATLAVAVFGGGVAWAAEAPVAMTEAQLKAVVAQAPGLPVDLELGLRTRLVDFIDCTNPDDLHDFMDQGTSRVAHGSAGRYRETAAHRHAFFSYRFRAAGEDKPVLIVIEYPDDAVRTINFSTHESGLSGTMNADWSLETGVYCGDPFPLSNEMRYHTFIMHCQDEWPAVLVGNFHRHGHPAAASRIWVFAIDGTLPKLDVDPPPGRDQRRLGHFNSIHFLPTSLYFGLRSPRAVEQMLDYFQYIGVNELSWSVLYNNSWGFSCTIPAWPGGDRSTRLDDVLAAMDARDGAMSFIAGFVLTRDIRMVGDATIGDLSADELRPALLEGFGQFLDRYGKYKSLRGIAIGAQFGIEAANVLQEKGVLADVVALVKERRPDIEVITYVGGRHLHREYFDGDTNPATAGDVVRRWERSGKHWPDFLGDEALRAWQHWKTDPATLRQAEGLTLFEQYQPDDDRIFANYTQQPRSPIYTDLDASGRRSDHLDTPHAAFWNTHYEGWYGLERGTNFWYRKHWVAPDFNAPPPYSTFMFSRALEHRDRLTLMPGSWNVKYFGWEGAARRFARAYRALPPVVMEDVRVRNLDTVKVRSVAYRGKRYTAVLSLIPFAATVKVDDRPVELPPYELVTLVDQGNGVPHVTGRPPEAYVDWVKRRVSRARKLMDEVRALDAEAVPNCYYRVANLAERELNQARPLGADRMLGWGLVNEMRLRKEILAPIVLHAPRVDAAPPMDGDLDAWPEEASDELAASGEYLPGHTYLPNSWTGPDDLSARVRFAHDGTTLYVGIEVRDSVVARYDDSANRGKRTFKRADSCNIRLSTDGGYLNWQADPPVRADITWPISVPFDGKAVEGTGAAGFRYMCRPTSTGYVIEGSAPLAELKARPGESVGVLLMVSDVDKTPNLYGAGWASKSVLLYPHQPNFSYWNDVRNCGRLKLGR